MRTTSILLLLLAFGPLRAAAQPVTGIVVEEDTGVPVAGAMVLLFGDAGDRVDRMLTDAAGRFRLEARRAAPHYIVVERIGYASTTTDRFTPAGGAEPMRVEVSIEPIRLRGLVVAAEPRCETRAEQSEATLRVWEEARKALSAEAWTREAGLYRYTLLHYERDTDREGRHILSEKTMAMTDRPSAFISVPIENLAEEGFVQSEGDTATVYFAPDANALLSDAFLDTHCFAVVDGGESTVGLSFQPVAGRTVPDIAGVLWLDAETAELQRIQFGYVNLLDSEEVGYPPGEVTFTRLPDGAWVVNQWWMRLPTLIVGRRGRVMRIAQRVEGGFTASITDASGRTVVDAASTSIFGVVTDTSGTAPPAGPVAVTLVREGGGLGATTSEDGSFLLTGLDTIRHVLRVPRPALRDLGLAEPEVTVDGRAGEVNYVRMKVPTVADALVFSCGGTPRPPDTAPVMGRIERGDGTPGGMRVRVRWPAATGYAGTPVAAPRRPRGGAAGEWATARDGSFVTATTTTDDRGYFLLCDVPYGSRIRVAVSDPAGADPPVNRTFFVPPGSLAVVQSIIMSSKHYNMTTEDYILPHQSRLLGAPIRPASPRRP